MRRSVLSIGRRRLPLISLNTLVVGSGAAALNAAVSLHALGQPDVAVATEGFGRGTTFNTGSDKQTYYKIGLAASRPETRRSKWPATSSPAAACTATLPWPRRPDRPGLFSAWSSWGSLSHDRMGAFIGYKTDHDPRERATSAGPLTSQLMGRALAAELKRRRIRVFDRHPVVSLLTASADGIPRVIGAAALDESRLARGEGAFVIFNAVNVVLARAARPGSTTPPSIRKARRDPTDWPSPPEPSGTT